LSSSRHWAGGALLFGIIHANSFLVGRDPLFVLSQIIASFLGAIGLGALRLRLNSIWPLIGLHALNDLVKFVATGGIEAHQVAIYIPILKIAISVVMALYGLYLLRGEAERQALSH
jgi:membrane protease YdiL (CAAX protease family)